MSKKLEKILELMINEETDKASDLLHDLFVEKSRSIYAKMMENDEQIEEEIIDEDFDDLDEEIDHGDESGDFEDDISSYEDEIDNEEMFGEAEDDEFDSEFDDETEDDAEDDLADEMVDTVDDETEGAEEAMLNVEDALDQLKAEFAKLVGDSVESEDDFDMEDETSDDEFDYSDEGDDEIVDPEDDEFGAEDDELEESADLSTVNHDMKKNAKADSESSSVAKNRNPDSARAVKFASQEGAPRKVEKPKDLGVDGPQEHGAKLKPAKAPTNKG